MTTQKTNKQAIQPIENKSTPQVSDTCKTALLAVMLARPEGATLPELVNALGWKENSVRGAMSTLAHKRIGTTFTSDKKDGVRRYHLIPNTSETEETPETMQ